MKRMIVFVVAGIILFSCSLSRSISKENKLVNDQKTAHVGLDTNKKNSKPYKEVITANAYTQSGLFKVHKVNDRYLFEIPDSLLERDLLLVNRISKGNFDGFFSGYGGDYLGESVIQFFKGGNKKVFIRQMFYAIRSDDSTDNGMYKSIQNSSLQPIIAAFDIKAISPDSAGVVIDITDFISSDNEFLFIRNYTKTLLSFGGLGGMQPDKSFVAGIKVFPMNVEIKTVKTYTRGAGGPFTVGVSTFELNNSIVLLPKSPMQSRSWDKRIGFFAKGYYNFDASKPVDIKWMISRWRLEPKDEDIVKYKRGELVEPKRPIIYYIDPATPKKWVPYLIQGVNDWQKAFEKAGFKNAVYALEAPVNDSNWSIEDARHNVIVYKASQIPNASGPQVSDPRSGEIIETHINWYHNVQQLIHDWYMIQAGPNDPAARTMQFDDSLMGRLIRYVCAHEVGHTLGLQHNFMASSTIPVDSLRNKEYVEKNGFCPSIMDYARFNYVAQPEDRIEPKDLIPRISVYDEWAIEWGYKWLPSFDTKENETVFMNKWIVSRLEKDKRLQFGRETSTYFNFDPNRQSEDVGDDAMKAGYYGIQNLKRIVPQLKSWTKVPSGDYDALKRMNNEVILQFMRYLDHVAINIGGLGWTETIGDEKGRGVIIPSRVQQKAAVKFLNQELFNTPEWILDNEIFRLTAGDGFMANNGMFGLLEYVHQIVLQRVVSLTTYKNLILAHTLQPGNSYTMDELLTDLEADIWSELNNKKSIDIYRRTLQKMYTQRIIDQLDPMKLGVGRFDAGNGDVLYTDIYPILKKHLQSLLGKISTALKYCHDYDSRIHLMEVRDRIKKSLYSSKEVAMPARKEDIKSTFNNLFNSGSLISPSEKDIFQQSQRGCWQTVWSEKNSSY